MAELGLAKKVIKSPYHIILSSIFHYIVKGN